MPVQPITSQEAAHRILSFLKDGRLVQGAWHRQDGARELACMIGAIDPAITGAKQCPSGVMPAWLSHVTVMLFDGQNKDAAMAWAERYAGLMARWHVLEPDAWSRIEVKFKIACVRDAIAAAEPVCKDKDYWPKVTAAAQQVCDALEGNGDLKAAADAAYAAYAAAAADAAAAAYAATTVGAAAYAAYAAAYSSLASKLLDAIELEVLSAESLVGAV